MPVTTGDINFYGAAMYPESDSVVGVGGTINTTIRPIFTDISANGVVEVLSTNGGDNQTITVSGRDSAGIATSENIVLNGTTPVTGSTSFSRILKIGVPSHTGIITVRKGSDDATIATMPSGILQITRLFINATANSAGGASKDFYEKIFIRNDNASTALLNASLTELSDPLGTVTFAFESGQNGNNSGTGRVDTIPNGMVAGSFTNDTKNFPNTNLAPLSGVGVWIKMTVAAGATPTGTSYQLTINGASA